MARRVKMARCNTTDRWVKTVRRVKTAKRAKMARCVKIAMCDIAERWVAQAG